MSDLPVLYSFRRCPYAMRARMAIVLSGQTVRLRELVLRDKPAEMLEASPKGSVPVLVLPDGRVVDESLDVMVWALTGNDPNGIFWQNPEEQEATSALIAENDGPFKHHLDRYKYETRYQEEGADASEHRAAGEIILARWNDLLPDGQFLGAAPRMADYAIFPFVRQFRIPDPDWFDRQEWPHLHRWLKGHMESPLFSQIMVKFPLFTETGEETLFGGKRQALS